MEPMTPMNEESSATIELDPRIDVILAQNASLAAQMAQLTGNVTWLCQVAQTMLASMPAALRPRL